MNYPNDGPEAVVVDVRRPRGAVKSGPLAYVDELLSCVDAELSAKLGPSAYVWDSCVGGGTYVRYGEYHE